MRTALVTMAALMTASCVDASDATREPVPTVEQATTVGGAPAPGTSAATAPSSSTASRSTGATETLCEPPADDDLGIVSLWHTLAGPADAALAELASAFEVAHPGTRIDLVAVDGGAAGVIRRLAETPAAEAPDVVLGSDLTVRLMADSGRFVPLTACAHGRVPDGLSEVLPVVAATYTAGGTMWAAPFNVSTPVLVYDKARWRAAGLDPDDPPSDLDEFEAAIRRLKDSGAASTGIALYDKSASWLITVTAVQADELLATPDNGRDGSVVPQVDLAIPQVIDALDRFRQLAQDGYVEWLGYDTGPGGSDDLVQLINPIAPTGMTLHTSGSLGALVALKDSGGSFAEIEAGVAAFPGPGAGTPAGGGAWWLVDTDDAARVGAAWRVVEWLTEPEQIAIFAAATGYAPTSPRAASEPVIVEAWSESPFLSVPYHQLAAGTGSAAGAGLQVGPGIEVDRELELAAAFAIDAGNQAVDELAIHGAAIQDLIAAYAAASGG